MDIPDKVLAAVKSAAVHDLFPVTGTESYAQPILKTRILQFDSGATLRLSRMDAPFLAICTRQILLRAPDMRSIITRDLEANAPAGAPGLAGKNGANGNQDGTHGQDGTSGSAGAPGQTVSLPALYLFAEEISGQVGSPVAGFDLELIFPGIGGGAGGAGGAGGDGGHGGPGRPGVDGALNCAQPAGDGGTGGNGGNGGPGGPGGAGTDGAALVYIGPEAVLKQLAWAKVLNVGGQGGPGGEGGGGGKAGPGGNPGLATKFCPAGGAGLSGHAGVLGTVGAVGSPGNKGTVSLILRPSLDDLFA